MFDQILPNSTRRIILRARGRTCMSIIPNTCLTPIGATTFCFALDLISRHTFPLSMTNALFFPFIPPATPDNQSLRVSEKFPTYPSPNSAFCPKCIVGSGEGLVGNFQKRKMIRQPTSSSRCHLLLCSCTQFLFLKNLVLLSFFDIRILGSG